MKKFTQILVLGTIMAFPFGVSATNEPANEIKEDVFLKCTIDVEGFYASGNCKKVLAAYREFKSIQ